VVGEEGAMNAEEQFVSDLIAVYIKHGMSLAHEDSQGAFIIEPYSEYNVKWLKETLDRPKN
jgi:hypothetical protein